MHTFQSAQRQGPNRGQHFCIRAGNEDVEVVSEASGLNEFLVMQKYSILKARSSGSLTRVADKLAINSISHQISLGGHLSLVSPQ